MAVSSIMLALAACSTTAATPPTPSPSGSGSPAATDLTVTVSNGKDERTFTVTCDPAGGTHPNPASACDFLTLAHNWGQDPFAPTPKNQACAEIYGGPATAKVTGSWNGRAVDATFNRVDSCAIDRWNNAVALLALTGNDINPPGKSPRPTKPPR